MTSPTEGLASRAVTIGQGLSLSTFGKAAEVIPEAAAVGAARVEVTLQRLIHRDKLFELRVIEVEDGKGAVRGHVCPCTLEEGLAREPSSVES